MSEKVALITGSTGGLGLETALGIARTGMRVILVGRNQERLDAAVDLVSSKTGNPYVKGVLADLSSQESVRALAQNITDTCDRLDVLVNNAGVWLTRPQLSPDGIEITWAVNHLSMVHLTLLLLPLLGKAPAARVVNVSSRIHRSARLDLAAMKEDHFPKSHAAYAQSKLANVLFTFALARRIKPLGITVNALHPGVVATGLWRNMGWLGRLIQLGMISAHQGAQTSVFLATATQVEGVTGGYFDQCRQVASSPLSQQEALQEELWSTSLEQLGMTEPFMGSLSIRSPREGVNNQVQTRPVVRSLSNPDIPDILG